MSPDQQKRLVIQLAGATIIGMPLIAFIIDKFSDSFDLRARLLTGEPIYTQVGIGIAGGLVIAALAHFIVSLKFMTQINNRYVDMIGSLKLSKAEMIFISICAGVGEEILFRGAIQPLLGIILTSVVFVAMHGYLSIRDWRITIYGVYMTGAIALLGFATETLGIWTAVTAHVVIDIYLLLRLYYEEDDGDLLGPE